MRCNLNFSEFSTTSFQLLDIFLLDVPPCTNTKSRIIGPCAMQSRIPDRGITAKDAVLNPNETKNQKIKKSQAFSRGGNSNDIAQGPIIRDFTVSGGGGGAMFVDSWRTVLHKP